MVLMPTPPAASVVAVKLAQRVEGDVGQLEAVPQGSEGAGHPVGSVRGGAVEGLGPDVGGGREADVGHSSPLVDSLAVGSEHLDGGWVEGDAAGLVGLGVLDSDELVGVGDGPGNRQRGKVEVEVAPAQPAQLASPRAGGGGDIDEAAQVFVVVGASLQETAEFFSGGRVDLPCPLGRRRRPEYRVGVEPTPAQGLVEGGERMAWLLRTLSGVRPVRPSWAQYRSRSAGPRLSMALATRRA
jgi:hypothetical protein